MHVVEDDSVYIFQGDVRILKREVSSLRGAIQPFRRWDNNTVHYTLTRFSSENEYLSNKVYQAINEIEHKTYLKFVPKVENDGVASYVNISLNPDKEADTASSDYIGRKEFGINNIVIPVSMLNHYTGVGVVVHEICHALGMYHEQSRADRDKYINIDFSNTSSPYQFKTYKERNESGIDIGEFDFNSIMLYSSFASAIDPYRPVMTKKNGETFSAQRFGLSEGDIQSLISLYPSGDSFKFESEYAAPEAYQDLDLEQIRQKKLKCPEPTVVRFELQHYFEPSRKYYNTDQQTPTLRANLNGGTETVLPIEHLEDLLTDPLDPKDCDIRLILEAENQLYGKEHYAYEIKINEPISSWNTTNWNL